MKIKSLLRDINLLLADLQINKTFTKDDRPSSKQRFSTMIDVIVESVNSNVKTLEMPKATTWLRHIITELENTNNRTDQLGLVTMLFLLLLNDEQSTFTKHGSLSDSIITGLFESI